MKNKDETIYVGYGIGCHYDSVIDRVKKKIKLSYLCDKKWGANTGKYDNISIISKDRLCSIENAVAIVFPYDPPIKCAIAKELNEMGVKYIFVDELLEKRSLNGKLIKEEGKNGVWKDDSNNVIYFHFSIPNDIVIQFNGTDNEILLEEDIVVDRLIINMGNKGKCRIGAHTRIGEAIMHIAYGAIAVGRDCLFSSQVVMRTHDGHPIFDRYTHERINMSKDVAIGNHVWIGEGVLLLPGAEIGDGSIVGARAVTSAQFEDHVIIAGVPAKIISRDICWSKDATDFTNYMYAEECATNDALTYC